MYKAIFRVDGSYELGMGDIVSCINLALELKDFDILFLSKYDEGIDKIKEFGYKVEKIPEDFDLEQEIAFIKKSNERFNPNIIITEHIRQDYEEFCKRLSKINKTLVIDFFGNIEIYNDILLNWNISEENQIYTKKNLSTNYYFGPKYVLLKESFANYHNLTKSIKDKVKKVLISVGGGDVRNLTPKIIDALKEFKELELDVVVGSAFKNRNEILKTLEKNKLNYNLIETKNDLSKEIYDADLAISPGGLNAFQLSSIGTPFLAIGATAWETERLKKMQELGICKFMGNFENLKKETLCENFKYLSDNKKEREKMSLNGKKLVDGKGSIRVSEIIINKIKNGN